MNQNGVEIEAALVDDGGKPDDLGASPTIISSLSLPLSAN